jgi:hypothetical protein
MADGKGISGVAVAAIFAGGILAWSGVKGFSVSTSLKDFISGKNPSKQTQTTPVSATSLFGGLLSALGGPFSLLSASGGTSGGSGATVTSGPGLTNFAKAVLSGIGAPATQANINTIIAWAHMEGGGGANNPLNTTLAYGGGTTFNSAGVKNYANLSIGATATVRTLLGGGYSGIVAALRTGNGACGSNSEFLTWSGNGYGSVC